MSKPDIRPADLLEALRLLTRLPLPDPRAYRGAKAAWAYPVAGLAVGGLGALTAWGAAGLAPPLAAGLVLAVMIITTGALHEDGLADTADGLWGGWTVARRLEIMKDSQIGSYGVIALILSLGLRWAALTLVIATPLAIVAVAVLSRAPMVAVMCALPNARATGLSSAQGRPGLATALGAGAVAILIATLLLGLTVLPLLLLLCVTTATICAIAKVKINGQTGDILGATQQLSEIALLLALTSAV